MEDKWNVSQKVADTQNFSINFDKSFQVSSISKEVSIVFLDLVTHISSCYEKAIKAL